MRKSDSIGRYGGDEFIILLSNTKLNEAILVADKLRNKVSEMNFPKVGKITISLGVAEVSDETKSVEELIKKADKNLYIAKQKGRGRLEYQLD